MQSEGGRAFRTAHSVTAADALANAVSNPSHPEKGCHGGVKVACSQVEVRLSSFLHEEDKVPSWRPPWRNRGESCWTPSQDKEAAETDVA